MAAAAPPAFAVECRCGAVARGDRTAAAQTVRCGRCGRDLFVFPVPPLPAELIGTAPPPAPLRSTIAVPPHVGLWLPPVVAGVAALIVVAAVVVAIVRAHREPDPAAADDSLTPTRAALRLDTHEQIVRAALADGSFRLARQELDAARRLHGRFPRLLATDRLEQFRQWHRQTALLADLLAEPIGDVFAHSLGLDDREWQAAFADRYAGKAFVLDTRVWRDAAGRVTIDYHLAGGGLTGDWDVAEFGLFRQLPLAQPQRLVFGARLADVVRTGRDRWKARPDPESGVLITDPSVAAGLSLPMDDDTRAVLRRQAAWAADLGGPAGGW
jgi:hypothetical protein